MADVELTYIGNDSLLSDCGTSTGDDLDAWCDGGANFEGLTITVSCNRITVNFGWFTEETSSTNRNCYFELRDSFGAIQAFIRYKISTFYRPSDMSYPNLISLSISKPVN